MLEMKCIVLFMMTLVFNSYSYCSILQDEEYYLPKGWSEICKPNISDENLNPVRIVCEPSSHDSVHLSLERLRRWTKVRHSNFTYIYDIRCKPGGNISFPWPLKAAKMVGLYVLGCSMLDIFGDWGKESVESMPDELKVIDVRHSVMKIRISSLISIISKIQNISSDYNCGHDETLESVLFRNVSYKLDYTGMMGSLFSKVTTQTSVESSTVKSITESANGLNRTETVTVSTSTHSVAISTADDVASSRTSSKPRTGPASGLLGFTDMLENLLRTQTRCNYDKLVNLDESVSDTLSVFHHQFLVQGSRYPNLVYLNYSHNNINIIPEQLLNWRLYFPKLKRLDISHNYISEAPFKFFPTRESGITYINLRSNNFTKPTVEEIIKWAEIPKIFIDIQNNPIHCDCELLQFITFLGNKTFFSGKGLKYRYLKNLTCTSPDNLRGKMLHTLDFEALLCPKSPSFVLPLALMGILVLVLFVLLVLTVRYRREIRILFFTRFHILLPGDETDLERDKKYDAFVSYSNEDEDWVIDTLCAKLESIRFPRRFTQKTTQPKESSTDSNDRAVHSDRNSESEEQTLRLCLHHRDFIPGVSILDNIMNSIQASRHTIIVISRHFMKSDWALEEFRQAYYQSIIEKRRHLIILLYEKIPDQNMDPLLKRCFKTFTYLDVSDRLFWDRVIYSLSTSQKLQNDKKKKSEDSTCATSSTSVFDIENSVPNQNVAMRPLSYSSSLSDSTSVPDVSEANLNNSNFVM